MVQRHYRMLPQVSGANVAALLPSLDASAPMPQHGDGGPHKIAGCGWDPWKQQENLNLGFSWRFSSSRRSPGIGSTILFVACLLLPFLESTDAGHV